MAPQTCSTAIGNPENGKPMLIMKPVKNLVREQRPAKNRDKGKLDQHLALILKKMFMKRIKSSNHHILRVTEKSIHTKMFSRAINHTGRILISLRERSRTSFGNRVLLPSPTPSSSTQTRR